MDYPISVEAEGLPAPSYQWQQLVTVEYNITTNSTDGANNSTTDNSTIARRDHSFHAERAIVSVDVHHFSALTHTLAIALTIAHASPHTHNRTHRRNSKTSRGKRRARCWSTARAISTGRWCAA